MKKTVIVILGPTATGKSNLAVRVAKLLGGEIISADSRQVYTGLDIATGKITQKEMLGVPHHLLDVVSSKKTFSVSEWKKLADKSIAEIISRGHVPIIVGGTGFYIQSIVDNIVLPEVPPDVTLRKKLENKSVTELVNMLKKLDPARLENIDAKNPARLMRAIEIATALGSVPPLRQAQGKNPYEFLQIGLIADMAELQKRIKARVATRMKRGMIAEAERLHTAGLSYKRMRELGLEYKYLADYLARRGLGGELSQSELSEQIYKSNVDYAKRQMTWFKRDKKIHWFDVGEKGWEKKVDKLLKTV